MSREVELLVGLVALLSLSACEVGRSVVGSRDSSKGFPTECMVPACTDMPEPKPPRRELPPAIGAAGCALRQREPSCATGAATPTGEGSGAGSCARSLSLEDATLDREALASLRCERVLLARSAAGTLRLEAPRWAQVDVEVAAVEPFVLELVGAELEQLRISLRGPATLRFVDSHMLSQIAISGDQPSARVELREASVSGLELGNAAGERFGGGFEARRSLVIEPDLDASSILLESVSLFDGWLAGERVELIDTTARALSLAADELVLNASALSELEVERCGRLAVYSGSLTRFRIPPCSGEATRLYGCRLNRGAIEGDIVADRAQIDHTRVGLALATDVELWESSLEQVALCAGTNRVAYDEKTSALCLDCQDLDATSIPIDACRDPSTEATPALLLKTCGALVHAPVCEPPRTRSRPPLK